MTPTTCPRCGEPFGTTDMRFTTSRFRRGGPAICSPCGRIEAADSMGKRITAPWVDGWTPPPDLIERLKERGYTEGSA